jgi:hypothetical protein
MDRLTKLLVAATGFAVVQTVTTVAFFQNAVGVSSAIFCWLVVVVVALRRRATKA